MVAVAVLVYRLPSLGAYSIRNTLSILFSPQDLRAVALLQRLDRSQTPEEEQEALRALAQTPSELSAEELLARLRPPSFSVRAEALATLRALPPSAAITEALVREHEFTTAHAAAEILGEQRSSEAVEALREALDCEDFMLCGKAMVSLAHIGDRSSFAGILEVFAEGANPREIIHGAKALGIFGDSAALPKLLKKLVRSAAPFVRDEIVLAMADILGMGDWFYWHSSTFLDNRDRRLFELRGELGTGRQEHEELLTAVADSDAGFAAAGCS